ncbi:Esterase FE4 [Eumeta japonica]|uniref:Carboxylic ester hydrolase n=1 Tax=Eumeta variegata TaxID=151549 RepID=A0A4C1XD06_EUMVA|nr:Esterase FE4 [Eumeta japonica]
MEELMRSKHIFTIATVILVISMRSNGHEDIIVNTQSGNVRGLRITSKISNFYAFLSIPYAKPPVGDLRFKIYFVNHSHRNPLSLGMKCMTEQKKVYPALSIPLTLMGMLGYLNLDIEEAPGNMGLMDVIEALKWIQKNIGYFGGDPTNITLGGLSSGGIMTHALMLSPRSAGLFHKVIIQSGTSLGYRFYHEDASKAINKLKETINMDSSSNHEVLTYLRALSIPDIIEITKSIKERYHDGYAQYYPFVITNDFDSKAEGPVLPKHPLDIIRSNNYTHMPMIIGYTSNEGIRLEPYMNILDFVNSNFHIVVPTDLFDIDDMSEQKMETARTIKRFYFGNKDLSNETFAEYANMCRDSWYAHITDYPIRLQGYSNYTRPIYYYIFGIDGAYNYQKIKDGYTSLGASHADDLGYMWHTDLFANTEPQDDFSDIARERMVKMWSNFVKQGYVFKK